MAVMLKNKKMSYNFTYQKLNENVSVRILFNCLDYEYQFPKTVNFNNNNRKTKPFL